MKRRILPFVFLLSILFTFALAFGASAQVFVKHDATGSNNGTSWQHAFTDLKAALNAAPIGSEIWVAAGTYKPDVPNGDPASTFLINKNLHLLGGFDGTETSADQRDPAVNETILSGDLNGDDPDSTFAYRSDNVMNVMRINADITNETLIDGFTIKNGHADGSQNNQQRAGGACYSSGSPYFRQCNFSQNYALNFGGAIHQNANNGKSLVLENCFFEKNHADTYGGSVSFSNRGNNNSFTAMECVFLENSSAEAGAILLLSQPNSNVANGHYRIEDCTFTGNSATGLYADGSAVFTILRGPNMTVEVVGSTFIGNHSDTGEGTLGLWATSNGTGSVLVDSCLFENNISYFGAAIQCGNAWDGGASVGRTIKRSRFIGNMAAKGGAFDLYNNGNSPMAILVEDCFFEGNTASLGGGAVSFSPGSNGFELVLSRCEILHNESPIGGAIEGYNFGGNTIPDSDIRIENCLIANNSSTGGAAIALDSIKQVTLLNATFVDNEGGIHLSDKSNLTLQNTILANQGFTEYTASSNSNFTSKGGNLVLDNSLDTLLLPTDKYGVAPDFDSNYFPTDGGNLVNAGNNDGVTATIDLAGNERIQQLIVDIGAFESPYFPVATKEVTVGKIAVSPSPAHSFLNVEFHESITFPLEVEVFDSQGKLLLKQTLIASERLDVSALVPGVYLLKAVAGERIFTEKFIKQ